VRPQVDCGVETPGEILPAVTVQLPTVLLHQPWDPNTTPLGRRDRPGLPRLVATTGSLDAFHDQPALFLCGLRGVFARSLQRTAVVTQAHGGR
jgi:hypothetical protein